MPTRNIQSSDILRYRGIQTVGLCGAFVPIKADFPRKSVLAIPVQTLTVSLKIIVETNGPTGIFALVFDMRTRGAR